MLSLFVVQKSPLFVLTKSKFLSNRSFRDGGALLIQDGEIVKIDRSHFALNRVLDTDGTRKGIAVSVGGKFTHPGPGLWRQWTGISYDSANQWNDEQRSEDPEEGNKPARGGAMAVRKTDKIDISFSTVAGNFAPEHGGGIFVQVRITRFAA